MRFTVLRPTKATAFGLAAALSLGVSASSLHAEPSVEAFYRGKTIAFVIGYSAGGGYDAYARLVARHIGHHIPGKPQVVPRNMPGAGGRVAAAYMSNVAPKDGTVLATADQSLPLAQAMGETLQFDVTTLNWIGNPNADNNTVATWHSTGVKTIDDAKQKEVVIGATGPNTSSQIPQVINAVLGTKFRIVSGYPGGNELNLAMERGETGGRGSNPWASWKATKPDWLREGKINILAQVGLKGSPDLSDVPLLIDLAKTSDDRALLKLLSAPSAIGRPIFTAPGVAQARVKALRDAFDAMVKDPAFLDDAKKTSLDIDPVPGEELQAIVGEIVATPQPIAKRLAEIIAEAPAQK